MTTTTEDTMEMTATEEMTLTPTEMSVGTTANKGTSE